MEIILNSLVKFPADMSVDHLFANIKQVHNTLIVADNNLQIRIRTDKYERMCAKYDSDESYAPTRRRTEGRECSLMWWIS